MIKREGLYCILLIDDDEATNFIHEMVIKMAGIDTHIEICSSARKALDYLTCKGEYSANTSYPQPGIIFLDINMPGMNGWDFLKEYDLLPDEQKAKVVVSMLTTSLNPDDQEKGNSDPNVERFMIKPLTADKLVSIIDANFKESTTMAK
jgi:CheY-like chemotaxis protein